MVTLKASYIVKPAEQLPDKVMYVSDCDQIKPLTHAPVVYFFRPTTEESLEVALQILKDSLSKALVEFYPLAGRLRWIEGGRVELHCNSMGALLIGAESELKIDDFGDFCPTPEIRSLIPSVDHSTTPIQEVPLLLVQVTKFSCGGFSLGSGMSHIVIDGRSAGHFVREWAKIAYGEKSDDHPFLDRTVLQPKLDQPLAFPTLKYSDLFPLPFLIGKSDNLEERKKETTAIILKLSKEQIEALKCKANQDLLHSKEQIIQASEEEKGNQDLLHGKAQIDQTAVKDRDDEQDDQRNQDPHIKQGTEEAIQNLHIKEQMEDFKNKGIQDLHGKEQFETLKNKANQDLMNNLLHKTGSQLIFSRFEAVAAHIWRCASMARKLKPEQETVLHVTVDFRNRLNPPLPQRYFGNAVMPCPVSSTVGELLSNPLSYAARKIRQAIEKSYG